MYVKVTYFNKMANGFTGAAYTYNTDLPLQVGDEVLCPVSNDKELKRAMVVMTDVPEKAIDPSWAYKIKDITEYYKG